MRRPGEITMALRNAHAATAMLRAAERGDRQAQINLAVMHDNRRRAAGPVPAHAVATEHGAQALKWWLRAANQGSAQAQEALAERYATGDGVERDLVAALAWYLLASPNLRGDDADRAVRTRRRLARLMAAADVQRAERRAAAWRPQREAAAAEPA
jgi:TPR repeat protein